MEGYGIMIIRDMFEDDINRPINGVIKVEQDADDVVRQEVQEYIITRELRKHFITFFTNYRDAFTNPSADIGVWISGFFGSGKSHFLKILSYILENKIVDGRKTVDYFRDKLADDPETFSLIEQSTRQPAETILFNIDVEGSVFKDKTAVIRVFAKVFYDHLGFYGENLKVAKLEQYIESQGKTEEFRRVFEEKKGMPWIEQRKAFAFNGKYIVSTLTEVLDMSEEDAQSWFNDKSTTEFSIADLVEDIKDYVDQKPADFRLVFMADEVGQYVGTDTDMLLNLQSLIEEIGSECGGKVWVVCTGQEAIDEIIKVRSDEFSRIQARFKTRLSLSSSSVDEVIQKRILKKNTAATDLLEDVYTINDAGLRNLFTFKDSIMDIKGYSDADDFVVNYPFVPYQFIILQEVFSEIRKHGNAGKHLSGGERSMLSGFQEAAQKVQECDENALVPFFRFYDTVSTFLDSSIRRVIDRCESAANSDSGIQPEDVDVLKLLYLIRYVDDIPANLDNIVILMADDIGTDKIALREKVRASLDRLLDQNYIGRSGEIYSFLTDEEQDVAREIKNTQVDTASITERIGQIIFGDIYTSKRYRYGIYDFSYDQYVDNTAIGSLTGGMRLRFLTVATDEIEKTKVRLMTDSKGQAIVVLPDSPYYESLENAMKIRRYVKQRNVTQLPKSVQEIIRRQQEEASVYESIATDALKKGIENAIYYVDGEQLDLKSGDAKSKIDQALEYLVLHVYSELDLITENANTDADIIAILTGNDSVLPGMEPNRDAAAKVEEYLEMQYRKNLPTSMADIQSRYQAIPYGWREIDIAAVVARLIYDQKVTIKYAGTTIQPNDPKLPDMLRKRSEVGRTSISIRIKVSEEKIREAREFLCEYFDVMDVPGDENGLVQFIIDEFTEQKDHYEGLNQLYRNNDYPDHALVAQALDMDKDILGQKKDNTALIDRLLQWRDDLEENKEKMQHVEGFFKNQVQIFDSALKMEKDLEHDEDYFDEGSDAQNALNEIRLICMVTPGKAFDYTRIPELNGLMATVRTGHDELLADKREEVLQIAQDCMAEVHQAANGSVDVKRFSSAADQYLDQKKGQIAKLDSLALLDSLVPQMMKYTDNIVEQIEAALKPEPEPGQIHEGEESSNYGKEIQKKKYKTLNRSFLFKPRKMESEEEIDAYLAEIREQLVQQLKNYDGIDLK